MVCEFPAAGRRARARALAFSYPFALLTSTLAPLYRQSLRGGESRGASLRRPKSRRCLFAQQVRWTTKGATGSDARRPAAHGPDLTLTFFSTTASMSTRAVPGKSSHQHLFGTYAYKGDPYRDRAKVGAG